MQMITSWINLGLELPVEYILNGDGSLMTEDQIVEDVLRGLDASARASWKRADLTLVEHHYLVQLIVAAYGIDRLDSAFMAEWETEKTIEGNIIDDLDLCPSNPVIVAQRIIERVYFRIHAGEAS